MKPTKNTHGPMNSLLGYLIVLFTGIYYSELPALLVVLLLCIGAFLVLRELWLKRAKKQWALIDQETHPRTQDNASPK